MKKIVFCLLVIILAQAGLIVSFLKESKRRNESLKTQIENVRAEYAPLIRSMVRDSVTVADHSIYTAKHSDVKEKLDKHLLSDIGLSLRQVNSVQTTSLQTNLDVTLPEQRGIELRDSVVIPKRWSFHDEWTDIEISDTTLKVSVKDSISTVVYREYKHRFLWWKWGTKSVRVRLVNFNPHSVIRYDEYTKMEN